MNGLSFIARPTGGDWWPGARATRDQNLDQFTVLGKPFTCAVCHGLLR
jgi:hypothetical protein